MHLLPQSQQHSLYLLMHQQCKCDMSAAHAVRTLPENNIYKNWKPELCCPGVQHPITCALASLQSQDLQAVLTMMSTHVPRTLEGLLLHALPPAAAELLTQKLEQADATAAATGMQLHQS